MTGAQSIASQHPPPAASDLLAVVPHAFPGQPHRVAQRLGHDPADRIRTPALAPVGSLPEGPVGGLVDKTGLDEHTACIIDLERQEVVVRGIGLVTWRNRDREVTLAKGERFPLEMLREDRES